jgi:hypothetical protein
VRGFVLKCEESREPCRCRCHVTRTNIIKQNRACRPSPAGYLGSWTTTMTGGVPVGINADVQPGSLGVWQVLPSCCATHRSLTLCLYLLGGKHAQPACAYLYKSLVWGSERQFHQRLVAHRSCRNVQPEGSPSETANGSQDPFSLSRAPCARQHPCMNPPGILEHAQVQGGTRVALYGIFVKRQIWHTAAVRKE